MFPELRNDASSPLLSPNLLLAIRALVLWCKRDHEVHEMAALATPRAVWPHRWGAGSAEETMPSFYAVPSDDMKASSSSVRQKCENPPLLSIGVSASPPLMLSDSRCSQISEAQDFFPRRLRLAVGSIRRAKRNVA